MNTSCCVRRLCYKKVPRPESFKIVSRKEYDPPSLGKHLATRMRAGGPISVADYMKAVLTHPSKGYYIRGNVFGRTGDFVTSPEISPLFGEMFGVWYSHELKKIGSPRPLQLVELGPGRGCLASDMLRIMKQIPPGHEGLSVHLVEVSERLAKTQAQRLRSSEVNANLPATSPFYQHGITEEGLEIFWYKNLESVPRGFSIYMAHEFFDALPVHKFQKVDGSWRELLVSLKNPEAVEAESEPIFELVLSRKSNPTLSALIPPQESRDHVEVCPQAGAIMSHLAERLEEDGGVAVIVDYGHCGEKTDTFRGFKAHALHDPLKNPGDADLTADVDFNFLRKTAGDRVCSFGPVNQKDFLQRIGIETRLEKVLSHCSQEEGDNLKSGVKMVVEDMGERFKIMAFFPAVLSPHLQRFPVTGFSDVS